MKRTWKPFLGFSLFALAAVAIASLGSGSPVHAQSAAGPVDTVAVDTNTTGNSPNGPLGTVQDCLETSSGASFDVDVVAIGIPPYVDDGSTTADFADQGGLIGFGFAVLFDETILNVVSTDDLQIIDEGTGSGAFFSNTEAPASANSDGTLTVSNTDFSSTLGSAEEGDGVIVRITFQAVGTGVSQIGLQSVGLNDGGNDVYDISSIEEGAVAVETDCTTVTATPTTPPTTTTPTASPTEPSTTTPAGGSPTPTSTGPTPTATATPTPTSTPTAPTTAPTTATPTTTATATPTPTATASPTGVEDESATPTVTPGAFPPTGGEDGEGGLGTGFVIALLVSIALIIGSAALAAGVRRRSRA